MTAVDTNVVVRLLTGDDPKQAAAARALFRSRQIWVAKTVLLETGWVLRSLYGYEERAIRADFIGHCGQRGAISGIVGHGLGRDEHFRAHRATRQRHSHKLTLRLEAATFGFAQCA